VLFSLRVESCVWSNDVPMDRTPDLEIALSFVVHRVEEQAKASGQPLNEEEHLLLKNLPSSNANYPIWAPDLGPPELVPRNINLERLCALTKAAYLHDRQLNPESLSWESAFAVFTLNRHPMSGLLQFAGMKRRRPRWDGVRLTVTASLPVVAVLLIALYANENLFRSVGIGAGCVAIMVFMFFGSKRIEKQRLNDEIERCRFAFRPK
jgi:hypothetical protein